ncbi:MAG: translation initiation factor, partial [Eubacteriaceae bacterium]|nr:translation initiation factor [Eubacteriaceae bacterium]
RVEEHDINVKVKNCLKFLEQGNRVKVSIRFRGREMAYTDRGKDVLLDFAERASELGVIEKTPKMEGRSMAMFLAPKKDK